MSSKEWYCEVSGSDRASLPVRSVSMGKLDGIRARCWGCQYQPTTFGCRRTPTCIDVSETHIVNRIWVSDTVRVQ